MSSLLPAPRPDRRRRPRGALDRLLTAPLPSPAPWLGRVSPPLRRIAPVLVLALIVTAGVAVIAALWSARTPSLAPRHRAEALCFALAQPPAFAPPMRVAAEAALVRGRFAASTPAAYAVREAMRLDEPMVRDERVRRIGDYRVTTMWVRLPPGGGGRHALIVAWMEGADLAVCTFRFAGDDEEPAPAARAWGVTLLRRVLRNANFRAGALPPVRLRGPAAPLVFGAQDPGTAN
jgi:hypothetical protein